MQNSSPETNILHKNQTPLKKQMTELVSIQHCNKVNRCKLMVTGPKWNNISKLLFFELFIPQKKMFSILIFFLLSFRKWILKNKWAFYFVLNSDFHSLLTKADLMQEFFLTGLPHPSKIVENMEANYNSNITVISHRLCFNWTHILTL